MADVLFTSDGKMHPLIEDNAFTDLVREYMGSDAEKRVRKFIEHDAYEEARAQTDADCFEESLESWQQSARDWVDELDRIIRNVEAETKLDLLHEIQSIRDQIYPVCFDFEYDSIRYAKAKGVVIGKAQATAIAKAFLDVIKAAGYIPSLYSNYDYSRNMFDLAQLPYDLWYAWYNSSCNRSDAQLWQYSSSGSVNGISGKVDLDYAIQEYASTAGSTATATSTTSTTTKKTYPGSVKGFQAWLNDNYASVIQKVLNKSKIAEDNGYGAETKKAAIAVWQTAMNAAYGCGLVVDGSYGSQSSGAAKKHLIKQGASGALVYIIQGMLYCHGINPGGLDGGFGSQTKSGLIQFQRAKGITADGTAGAQSFGKFYT